MSVDYTNTALISDIRATGHIPQSQTAFSDSNLLALADKQLQTHISRQIVTVRENYFTRYQDVARNLTGLYDIPSRSVAGALVDIQLVSSSEIIPVVRMEIGEQFSTVSSPNGVYSAYLMGNQVQILPIPNSTYVRFWFNTRPSKLIPVTQACQITEIAGNVLTVNLVPTSITTSTPVDIVQGQPHFSTLLLDSTPTVVTATTITLPSVPSGTAVGDWVTLANQSPVAQIPVEFRGLLVQRTVMKYYEIQGYKDKMEMAKADLKEMTEDLYELINPRISEEPKKITASTGLIGGYYRWRTVRAN